MLKTLIRPAMVFVPLTVGMFLPQLAAYSFMIRYFIMAMLFLVFLGLDVRDMKLKRSHFLILLLNIFIGTGGYWLVKNISGDDTLAKAAFFTGITPTATAAAVVMAFLGGNVGYIVSAFVITNVGVALCMPLLLSWVCGNFAWSFMLHIAESLFYLLVVPWIAALVIRKFYPAARELPKKIKTFTFSLWSVGLLLIASTAADFLLNNPDVSKWVVGKCAAIALIICILNFGVGYLLGEKSLRHEASQSLGQKNTTLTIYLALVYADPVAAMGVISYVLWHNSYNAMQFFFHDRRKNQTPAADTQTK